MKLPANTAPFLYGMAAGAIALAVIGFNFSGWMTPVAAAEHARARVELAKVEMLTTICVAQFQKDPNAKASLAALVAKDRWDQADYVSEGGWATMPGGGVTAPSRDVTEACAKTLAKRDV